MGCLWVNDERDALQKGARATDARGMAKSNTRCADNFRWRGMKDSLSIHPVFKVSREQPIGIDEDNDLADLAYGMI